MPPPSLFPVAEAPESHYFHSKSFVHSSTAQDMLVLQRDGFICGIGTSANLVSSRVIMCFLNDVRFNNAPEKVAGEDRGAVKRKVNPQRDAPDPPGKTFYLNRLGFMDDAASSHHSNVSLQELLHPVESITRMFIATFTSDILWFLSSREIPNSFSMTLACHSSERCWDASPEKKTHVPYPDFPNQVVVYPMFPEEIAFGKDLRDKALVFIIPNCWFYKGMVLFVL